jgi:hypothetical protein
MYKALGSIPNIKNKLKQNKNKNPPKTKLPSKQAKQASNQPTNKIQHKNKYYLHLTDEQIEAE